MKKVKVNNKMQKDYEYELTELVGKNFHKDFKPDLNIIREKSFRSKCEKRWVDKANSMLYEQRPFFKEENIKIKSQIVSNGYPNID